MPLNIHKDALLLHEGIEKNLLCRCNLETFLGNKVITDMYVYMICRNFLWNATMWYFISEPKFQVLHGILHDVFSKEELKDTGIV